MLSAFPAITNDEFAEAARSLQQCFAATSKPDTWLNVCILPGELQIKQQRMVVDKPCTKPSSLPDGDDAAGLTELEDIDEETIIRKPFVSARVGIVDYSIVLSPTYQVPVLWFSSPSIPETQPNAIETVYEDIVSSKSQAALRQVGVLGGISIAEHPTSGLPAFFVHPCRTHEALALVRSDGDITAVEYLMLWFGIIATSVGLSVPPEIAQGLSMRTSVG